MGVPPQDLKAKLFFALAYLAAYRGLRDVQLLCRSSKVQLTSNRKNILQLSEWRDYRHGTFWK